MSAPSRRPEIRRRRTRHEKVQKLKKNYARGATEADKTRVAAKLERMALKSPGQPLVPAV
jgi:Family of unknown function (DUF6800)